MECARAAREPPLQNRDLIEARLALLPKSGFGTDETSFATPTDIWVIMGCGVMMANAERRGGSIRSVGSTFSVLSIFSVGSVLSIFSF